MARTQFDRLTHFRDRAYFGSRYLLALVRISMYRRIHGYPASLLFLQIPTSCLNYTEFNSAGHRDISSRNVYRIVGKVIDGDWDRNRTHIQTWPIFGSLRQYLLEGVDLRSTAYYVSEPDKGRRSLWHQITEANYEKEARRNWQLFEALKAHGYRSQRELGGPDPLDEIRVKIGRDGEFLWENSIHRFVIAKLLALPQITVLVTVRHRDWVELRKKLTALPRTGSPAGTGKYRHPDLVDIPFSPEGAELVKAHYARYADLPGSRCGHE
jgi:hypothetical protein